MPHDGVVTGSPLRSSNLPFSNFCPRGLRQDGTELHKPQPEPPHNAFFTSRLVRSMAQWANTTSAERPS